VAYPEPLADKLYQETKKFLEDHVSGTLSKVSSGGEQALLNNYHNAWKEFSQGINYLHMLYS
jgi:cullin 2